MAWGQCCLQVPFPFSCAPFRFFPYLWILYLVSSFLTSALCSGLYTVRIISTAPFRRSIYLLFAIFNFYCSTKFYHWIFCFWQYLLPSFCARINRRQSLHLLMTTKLIDVTKLLVYIQISYLIRIVRLNRILSPFSARNAWLLVIILLTSYVNYLCVHSYSVRCFFHFSLPFSFFLALFHRSNVS